MNDQPDKYYLVAIPDGDIAVRGAALQEGFSRSYGVYSDPYPPLHLTVGVLSFPPGSLEKVKAAMAGAIIPFLPLTLLSLGESCFPAPFKSINLSIERSATLVELSARVHRAVTGAGYGAESFEHWDYHISLVNCNYAAREWSEAEFREACRLLARENLVLTGSARRLELWEPSFPPLKILASFEK